MIYDPQQPDETAWRAQRFMPGDVVVPRAVVHQSALRGSLFAYANSFCIYLSPFEIDACKTSTLGLVLGRTNSHDQAGYVVLWHNVLLPPATTLLPSWGIPFNVAHFLLEKI